MLERLFPRSADNDYRGSALALWAFYPITAVTIVRSLIHVFRHDGGAQSIATIPLDAYTPEGASTVILIFALWGLSQLLVGFVYAVVLWRYRSLLPLMYLLFVVEWTGRLALGYWKPIETEQTAPGAVGNLIFPVVGVILLWLSLRTPATRAKPAEAPAT